MSSDSTSPTASPSTDSPPPPAHSTTSPPPPSTTPPLSPPTATPPPPTPSSSPPPTPSSSPPPPAPPTSSPPPPSSTPPPATPVTTQSPPPPASSASTPPPSPPSVTTPSPPTPEAVDPVQNSPPTPVYPPPQEKPVSGETPRPPSFSPNPPRSGAGSGSNGLSEGSSSSGDDPSLDGGVIAGIAVGGVVVIALLFAIIICLVCCIRRKRKPQYYMDPGRPPNGTNQYPGPGQWHTSPNEGGNGGGWGSTHATTSGEFTSHPMPPSANMGGITHFSYEEMVSATNGFCESNLLGQGGFGQVHKGILPDGREVAVKGLKSGSGQGEREFQAEVEIISRVHHRHLVSLVGYCIAGDRKLLVYEYVANKTMEFHLHGTGQPVLDWSTRLRIAIGSAKGLAYLHEDCLPRIIHRDIKAANILIDNNYEAMVADFGLAKLTTDNHTHVSTRVMGTFGYLAPEYASSGKLSEKSDVFSFGVMLLELITGRRPIDLTNTTMEDSLVDWARPLLANAMEDGNYDQLVDPRLQGNYLQHELARMAACAAASIRHSARKRPKMSQIVRALEGDSSLEDLKEGGKQTGQSAMYGGTTEVYDTRAYNADMMKFKKMVMPTQEFSSEFNTSSDADSMEMETKKS